MKQLVICCFLFGLFLHAAGQKTPHFSIEDLLKKYPEQFDSVMKHKEDYRLQILYTQVTRDKYNFPHLTTYSFDADKYYYYPASLIKMMSTALALEKINDLHYTGLDKYDSLQIELQVCDNLFPENMMMNEPNLCIGQLIKEMFLVSNNYAFNPMYDFIGQEYFQNRLRELGYSSAVITSRFSSCDSMENRYTNPVCFYDRVTGKIRCRQNTLINENQPKYDGPLDPKVGTGVMDGSELIPQPKDFTYANYMSLTDIHSFLTRLMLPETQEYDKRLRLTGMDYAFLHKYMGMKPRESVLPVYSYPDNYMKFFIATDTTGRMPENIRVFNKVGQAYGFMTDCSYVQDTLNKLEFFLSCSMYLNKDGILNDSRYEYESIGTPFFRNLFNAIYLRELERKKKYKPVFDKWDFTDSIQVHPVAVINPIKVIVDTTKTIPEMETILAPLAKNITQPVSDSDSLEGSFLLNLEQVLHSPKSLGYDFLKLKEAGVQIVLSNDKRIKVFSWLDKHNGQKTNEGVLQYKPKTGVSSIHQPISLHTEEAYFNDRFEKIFFLDNSKDKPRYLVFSTRLNEDGKQLNVVEIIEFEEGVFSIGSECFSINKEMRSEIIVERNTKNPAAIYDPKKRMLTIPEMSKGDAPKWTGKYLKLTFDGRVFKK